MASLYGVQYAGENGTGMGALYLGNGVIAGFDLYGGHFKGTYTEQNGRLNAKMTLSLPGNGVSVAGHRISLGAGDDMSADWPSDLGNGRQLQMTVGGRTVHVHFKKMLDVP
jgi:hypothetical protein